MTLPTVTLAVVPLAVDAKMKDVVLLLPVAVTVAPLTVPVQTAP